MALRRMRSVLRKHSLVFVAPAGLALDAYDMQPGEQIQRFHPAYFASIAGYNRLMLSGEFYEKFAGSAYVLICQLDVWVFRDRLEELISLGYDYIGAPWPDGLEVFRFDFRGKGWIDRVLGGRSPKLIVQVGNGGCSLRRVAGMRELLRRHPWRVRMRSCNEDILISTLGLLDSRFKVAPVEVALRLAYELEPRRCHGLAGELPVACHAWEKHDEPFVRELSRNYEILDTSNPTAEQLTSVR